MHCIAARVMADTDDVGDVQVGFHRSLAAPDLVGLFGLEAVQRQPILFREYRHRRDAQLRGSAHYANGDLAAIGYEDFIEGHISRGQST